MFVRGLAFPQELLVQSRSRIGRARPLPSDPLPQGGEGGQPGVRLPRALTAARSGCKSRKISDLSPVLMG